MNLAELKKVGGIVDCEPVRVPVEWNGHKFDVLVKKLAFAEVEKARVMLAGDGKSQGAALIAAAVVMADTGENISYDDAAALNVGLATKLMDAVVQVNALGESAPN